MLGKNQVQRTRKKAVAKSTKTPAASTTDAKAKPGEQAAKKPLTAHQQQELKRQERLNKLDEARAKLDEQIRTKKAREKERLEQAKKKRNWALFTFVLGLLVMLTALIALFPSPAMIVFSTLLMFTFFFLGFTYQRMVMQLMVVALACVVIVGAFYSILNTV